MKPNENKKARLDMYVQQLVDGETRHINLPNKLRDRFDLYCKTLSELYTNKEFISVMTRDAERIQAVQDEYDALLLKYRRFAATLLFDVNSMRAQLSMMFKQCATLYQVTD